MLITVAVIVVGVDHSQMPAQLVHDAVNVTGQISMAGIETDTHLHGIHCSQNPEQVARVRKQQVWEFIFQDASDPELTATLSDLIQRVCGPSQSLEPFVVLFQIPTLRSRVDYEISDLEGGGRFRCLKDFR
jgi:hypothetical protein